MKKQIPVGSFIVKIPNAEPGYPTGLSVDVMACKDGLQFGYNGQIIPWKHICLAMNRFGLQSNE